MVTTGASWAPFLHLSRELKQPLVAAVPTKGGGRNQAQARPAAGLGSYFGHAPTTIIAALFTCEARACSPDRFCPRSGA